MTTPPAAGISGLAHVALRTRDIDAALAFYVGRLGFAELLRLDRDGRLWLVYLRISDTQFIEIFPEGAGERAPGREAVGVNHFCLAVDDIHAVVERLERAGVALAAPKKIGADGNWQAWIEDPDGVRIELMQMARDSLQARALARLRDAMPAPALA